jgi:hypothetical protein
VIRESRPTGNQAAQSSTKNYVNSTAAPDFSLSSQAVQWWPVHGFAEPRLQEAGDWPLVGTPAWCLLETCDPAKWAAILDAAQHWALRLETCQERFRDAGHAVAGAVDWSALAHHLCSRDELHRARPYLRRVHRR